MADKKSAAAPSVRRPKRVDPPEVAEAKAIYGKKWEAEQITLRNQLILTDDFNWTWDKTLSVASAKKPKAKTSAPATAAAANGKISPAPAASASGSGGAGTGAGTTSTVLSYAAALKKSTPAPTPTPAATASRSVSSPNTASPPPPPVAAASPPTPQQSLPPTPKGGVSYAAALTKKPSAAAAATPSSAAPTTASAKPISTLAPQQVADSKLLPAATLTDTKTTAAPPPVSASGGGAGGGAGSAVPLRLIGGVDISFVGEEADDACAALVILEYPSLKVVHELYEMVHLTQPYIPGFLAFREVEFLAPLFKRLKSERPELYPQLVFVDGNGRLHQRGFGLASHLGVVVGDVPTIGVGKKLLMLEHEGLHKRGVQVSADQQLTHRGAWIPLIGTSGTTWGAAVRSGSADDDDVTSGHIRPIFVSIGHRISLETAVALTQQCIKYRVPEPIRVADLGSRNEIRKWLATHRPGAVLPAGSDDEAAADGKQQKQKSKQQQPKKPKPVNPNKANKQQSAKQPQQPRQPQPTAAASAGHTPAASITDSKSGSGGAAPTVAPVANAPPTNAWLNRTATAALASPKSQSTKQ